MWLKGRKPTLKPTTTTRRDYQQVNDQAAEAARWMRDEMERREGVLAQDHAWEGVRERFGETCALKSETDRWLSRPVLTAFRKITPDVIWDPTGHQWRLPARSDTLAEGARMVTSKSKSK